MLRVKISRVELWFQGSQEPFPDEPPGRSPLHALHPEVGGHRAGPPGGCRAMGTSLHTTRCVCQGKPSQMWGWSLGHPPTAECGMWGKSPSPQGPSSWGPPEWRAEHHSWGGCKDTACQEMLVKVSLHPPSPAMRVRVRGREAVARHSTAPHIPAGRPQAPLSWP